MTLYFICNTTTNKGAKLDEKEWMDHLIIKENVAEYKEKIEDLKNNLLMA